MSGEARAATNPVDHADPCPFCAGGCLDYNLRRKGRRYYEAGRLCWSVVAVQYNIKCVGCEAQGPKAKSLVLAVEAWNKPTRLDE